MLATLLALAAAVAVDPGVCRQRRIGPSEWTSDGRGVLTASTDARTTGELSLRCRLPVPADSTTVTLVLQKLLISFQPAGSKTSGAGLVIQAGGCRIEIVRVAGEDWIETPRRAWTFRAESRVLDVTVTLRDVSEKDPVRIDLTGLRLLGGPAEEAQVCESVDDKLNGDRGKNESH
jgi:hypothetical protein